MESCQAFESAHMYSCMDSFSVSAISFSPFWLLSIVAMTLDDLMHEVILLFQRSTRMLWNITKESVECYDGNRRSALHVCVYIEINLYVKSTKYFFMFFHHFYYGYYEIYIRRSFIWSFVTFIPCINKRSHSLLVLILYDALVL